MAGGPITATVRKDSAARHDGGHLTLVELPGEVLKAIVTLREFKAGDPITIEPCGALWRQTEA